MGKRYCGQCGYESTDGKAFCAKCGNKLSNNTNVQVPVQQNVTVVTANKKTNVICIIGFIFSFLVAIIGLILSIVGLISAKNNNEGGKGLAIAGIIISAINMILAAFILIFFSIMWPQIQADLALETACSEVNSYGYLYTYYDGNKVSCRNYECTIDIDGKYYEKSCSRYGY